MVRLSTAGAVPEVIEGVAAPVVTVTVAVAFAAKGAALGDPQALRASRPLAANKTAMRYLMIPPDRNDAIRRLFGSAGPLVTNLEVGTAEASGWRTAPFLSLAAAGRFPAVSG